MHTLTSIAELVGFTLLVTGAGELLRRLAGRQPASRGRHGLTSRSPLPRPPTQVHISALSAREAAQSPTRRAS
jgi:hypothetical protein